MHLLETNEDAIQFLDELFTGESELESWVSSYPKKVQDVVAMDPGGALWPAAVTYAIEAGTRDDVKLTNLAFYMLRPERNGRPISKGEKGFGELVALWKWLRKAVRNILRDFKGASGASSSTGTIGSSSHPACKVQSKGFSCGGCVAKEQRIRGSIPTRLVDIEPHLRYYKRRSLKLTPEAASAYSALVEAARRDGIKEPYLKVKSAFRGFDYQAGLWNSRLKGKFRAYGCDAATLNRVFRAAQRTSKALKGLSIPHSRNAWLSRFREELNSLGPVPKCGRSDSVGAAVANLRKTTAPPGRSPHHTGRAVDIHVGGRTKSSDAPMQRRTAAFRWLVCNAARFGFRPLHNEPWHWEYTPAA